MATTLERIHPRNLKFAVTHLQGLVRTHLWAQILLGMVLGIGVGVALGPTAGWVERDTARIVGEWLALPGMLFLALIQMIVIPLIVTAIIRGIAASNDADQLKKNGLGLAAYFVATTVIATATGLGLALLLRPGSLIDPDLMRSAERKGADVDLERLDVEPGVQLEELPDEVISLFPTNPLMSMVEGQMLQVVLFSILIGIALLGLKAEQAKPVLDLMGSIQELTMKIVGWAMRLAPLAVFGLLARQMISTGAEALYGLGSYTGTFLLGMALLMALYVAIVAFLGDGQPLRFLTRSRDAQLMAFSTDSSAATMPITIRVAEQELGVRPSTAQFVIPIGASVNMGGSALYHGLATVFMAQIYGMDLSTAALLALVVTSLGASIGTPATPGVGIVVLATVLTSAGVPVGGIGLILGLDQILERLRTVLNVSGDLAACTVMDRWVGADKPVEYEVSEERAMERRREREHDDVVVT
ncbi:MAG: dicarboxylate/amino acid:cation symporter [Myxococcota bacterium]